MFRFRIKWSAGLGTGSDQRVWRGVVASGRVRAADRVVPRGPRRSYDRRRGARRRPTGRRVASFVEERGVVWMKLYLTGGPASLWSPCSQMEGVLLRGRRERRLRRQDTVRWCGAGGIGRRGGSYWLSPFAFAKGSVFGRRHREDRRSGRRGLEWCAAHPYLGMVSRMPLCIKLTSYMPTRTRRRRC